MKSTTRTLVCACVVTLAIPLSFATPAMARHLTLMVNVPREGSQSISTGFNAINDVGHILGTNGGESRQQFVIQNVAAPNAADRVLTCPDGSPTVASGINRYDEVVGTCPPANGFLLTPAGHYFEFRYSGPEASPGGSDTRPAAINDKREIVGHFDDKSGLMRGFKGNLQALAVLDAPFPDAEQTILTGINDAGDVVGYYFDGDRFKFPFGYARGFVIRNGVGEKLEIPLPNVEDTYPMGINDHGHIVGFFQTFDFQRHTFLYFQGNYYYAMADPMPHARTTIIGINNRFQMIGGVSIQPDPAIPALHQAILTTWDIRTAQPITPTTPPPATASVAAAPMALRAANIASAPAANPLCQALAEMGLLQTAKFRGIAKQYGQ